MSTSRPLMWDVRSVSQSGARREGLVTAPVPLEPRVSPAPLAGTSQDATAPLHL